MFLRIEAGMRVGWVGAGGAGGGARRSEMPPLRPPPKVPADAARSRAESANGGDQISG
jgi:hypothetical protein